MKQNKLIHLVFVKKLPKPEEAIVTSCGERLAKWKKADIPKGGLPLGHSSICSRCCSMHPSSTTMKHMGYAVEEV